MASMEVGDLTLESLHQVWMHLYFVFYFLLLTHVWGLHNTLQGRFPVSGDLVPGTPGFEYFKNLEEPLGFMKELLAQTQQHF